MWPVAPSIDSGRMEVSKGKFEAKIVQLGGQGENAYPFSQIQDD